MPCVPRKTISPSERWRGTSGRRRSWPSPFCSVELSSLMDSGVRAAAFGQARETLQVIAIALCHSAPGPEQVHDAPELARHFVVAEEAQSCAIRGRVARE